MESYQVYLNRRILRKRLLIYGAGTVAYYLAYDLLHSRNYCKMISGFVVRNRENDVSGYWGIPVGEIFEYEDEKNDYCIVIAVRKQYQGEIKDYLGRHGWRDLYFLTEEEYFGIREKYHQIVEGEYIIKQFEMLRKTLGRMENYFQIIQNTADKILNETEYCYDYAGNGMDRKNYLEDFRQLRETDFYFQAAERLCQGLVRDDVEIIYRILDRLNKLCDNVPIRYTDTEKKEIKRADDEFYLKKYKIAGSFYRYQNHTLPLDHFEASVFLYKHGIGLLGNLEQIKDKCVIDAGGFIGDSALVFSTYFNGTIYSFEADPKNYRVLKETIALNKADRIIPVNKALMDRTGKIELYRTLGISCSTVDKRHAMSELGNESIMVDCTSIDQFVRERALSVGLIKTDVEGAEQCLLKGAKQTILSQRPALIISIYHSMDDFFTIKSYIESLNAGYKFRIFHPVLRESFILETCLIGEAMKDE